MDNDKHDLSLGELFSTLAGEIQMLIRQEIELAKAEMAQKARILTGSAVAISLGGAFALAGFLTLIASAVIGLSYLLPWWLSALAIGAFLAVVGLIILLLGVGKIRRLNLAPEQTIESIKEIGK